MKFVDKTKVGEPNNCCHFPVYIAIGSQWSMFPFLTFLNINYYLKKKSQPYLYFLRSACLSPKMFYTTQLPQQKHPHQLHLKWGRVTAHRHTRKSRWFSTSLVPSSCHKRHLNTDPFHLPQPLHPLHPALWEVLQEPLSYQLRDNHLNHLNSSTTTLQIPRHTYCICKWQDWKHIGHI